MEQSVKSGYEAASLRLINALSHRYTASDSSDHLEHVMSLAGQVNGVGCFSNSAKSHQKRIRPLGKLPG